MDNNPRKHIVNTGRKGQVVKSVRYCINNLNEPFYLFCQKHQGSKENCKSVPVIYLFSPSSSSSLSDGSSSHQFPLSSRMILFLTSTSSSLSPTQLLYLQQYSHSYSLKTDVLQVSDKSLSIKFASAIYTC